MKTAYHKKRVWFWVSLLSSVLGGIAIPGIPLSAVRGSYFPMAVCILLVAHAFYGLPFYWGAYATAAANVRACRAVIEQHLTRVSDIAAYLCRPVPAVRSILQRCCQRGLLDGYLLNEDSIVPICPPEAPRQYRCPYCLSVFQDNPGQCPYCGGAPEALPEDK